MDRGLTLFINIIGGVAVLGSYAHGLQTHPGQGDLLWGDLPQTLRGIYTGCMLPAAVGYLTFTAYLLSCKPEQLSFRGEPVMPLFQINYSLFLVTAALWMPMCWLALGDGGEWLWLPIQAVLVVTGAGAAVFIYLLVRLEQPPQPRFHKAAVAGACFLFLQCGILDALIWPRFFHLG